MYSRDTGRKNRTARSVWSENRTTSIIHRAKSKQKKNYLTVSLLPKSSGAAAALASCTTCLCLCKSLKDRSLDCLRTRFWAKADAKVRLFLEPPNISDTFFDKKRYFSAYYIASKYLHHIILYNRSDNPSKIVIKNHLSGKPWFLLNIQKNSPQHDVS